VTSRCSANSGEIAARLDPATGLADSFNPDAGDRVYAIAGPVTFVTALAFRQSTRAYRFPEERPIIG
jgi:hypothetical protein